MVAQTFSKWFLIADFQVNRDYIAKNLCVNRIKPCCCCRGKCYLNKKMAADESQQQAPGKGGQRDETVLQAHRPAFMLPAPVETLICICRITRYIDKPAQGYTSTAFEPPRRTSVFC
jgi:hypothetical protein